MSRQQVIEQMMARLNQWESLDIQQWLKEVVLPVMNDTQVRDLHDSVVG